jgi:hypothetical protein
MITEIQVTVRSVYGAQKIYPVNAVAEKLAKLVGAKTLSGWQLALAQDLGCSVEFVEDPKARAAFDRSVGLCLRGA